MQGDARRPEHGFAGFLLHLAAGRYRHVVDNLQGLIDPAIGRVVLAVAAAGDKGVNIGGRAGEVRADVGFGPDAATFQSDIALEGVARAGVELDPAIARVHLGGVVNDQKILKRLGKVPLAVAVGRDADRTGILADLLVRDLSILPTPGLVIAIAAVFEQGVVSAIVVEIEETLARHPQRGAGDRVDRAGTRRPDGDRGKRERFRAGAGPVAVVVDEDHRLRVDDTLALPLVDFTVVVQVGEGQDMLAHGLGGLAGHVKIQRSAFRQHGPGDLDPAERGAAHGDVAVRDLAPILGERVHVGLVRVEVMVIDRVRVRQVTGRDRIRHRLDRCSQHDHKLAIAVLACRGPDGHARGCRQGCHQRKPSRV